MAKFFDEFGSHSIIVLLAVAESTDIADTTTTTTSIQSKVGGVQAVAQNMYP